MTPYLPMFRVHSWNSFLIQGGHSSASVRLIGTKVWQKDTLVRISVSKNSLLNLLWFKSVIGIVSYCTCKLSCSTENTACQYYVMKYSWWIVLMIMHNELKPELEALNARGQWFSFFNICYIHSDLTLDNVCNFHLVQFLKLGGGRWD